MSAYWIGRAKVRDIEGIKEYSRRVALAAPLYPHETLTRNGPYKVLEGPDYFDRFVVHKFPSMEAALAYYNSPEYSAASAIRRAACDGCELVITEPPK